jgi:DNA mismatch repair protein MutL
VQTLFFNVPARRKFLKSEAAEASRIVETLESIAMGHPRIRFTLTHGSKKVLDLASTEDPRRRASEVLDVERAALTGDKAALLEASGDEGPLTVWGLVGRPELARANAKHLRIHLNGRPVADRAILHAVREAYRGLIAPGLTPLAAIFLELHPREVDVNVHPAKTEVRFRQPSMIHQGVLRAVRRALRAADLVPAFELAPPTAAPAPGAPLAWRPSGGSAPTWSPPSRTTGGAMPPLEDIAEALGVKPWAEPRPEAPATGRATESSTPLPTVARAVEILQVHSAYLVTQDAEGLLIVDQHALHERVMFEKLFERVARGPLERQALLVPAIVECGAREIESLEALAPLFERLGIEATPAGPRSIAVHAFPSFLFERGVDAGDFLRELVAKAADGTLGAAASDAPTALATEVESALADTLDMMACKAAVKAGDRLTIEELRELLAWRERVERSTNCPHGRPTSLRITMRDLERQFGRG